MKINSRKPRILLLSALALALIAGGAYVYSANKNNETPGIQTTAGDNEEEKINYKPPTNEEKKSADNIKERNISESEVKEDNKSYKTVKPDIGYHGVSGGNVEVSSSVIGIYEKSGRCTLSLKKGSKTVSQSKAAVQNISEMSCGLIRIPVSKLSAGNWSATVTYSSSKAKGTSDAVTIEVK